MMRLLAILLLALSVIATGEGFLTPSGAAVAQSQTYESVEHSQGAVIVARNCLQRSGIPVSGGIICQADKRVSDSRTEIGSGEWIVSRTSWPAASSGNGIEPAPALDPPRFLS
jgi:hypothetical protein